MQREKAPAGEKVKRFLLTVLGSVFVQVFCWALYSYFEMSVWMCALSVIVTAMLYHFVQAEEETGLSRLSVFIAAILIPFLAAGAVTVFQMLRYPQLNLLGAELDGVSPLTEIVSLYAARLLINGAVLLIFAAVDRKIRRDKRGNKDGKTA